MLQTKGVLNYEDGKLGDPCGDYITDKEFLIHMIPHHQVAIDMSKRVMKYSTDPSIIYLARNIVYGQTEQILFMENVLLSGIPDMGSDDPQNTQIIPNQFTVYYPFYSRSKDNKCGLHHFSTKEAIKHEKHMKDHNEIKGVFTDKAFLEHMIDHHDVAIEMSNRVTRHSDNPLMVEFAYDIIKNQRHEIWLMKTYLLKSQKQCSPKFTIDDPKKVDKNNKIVEGFSRNRSNLYSYLLMVTVTIFLLYLYLLNK